MSKVWKLIFYTSAVFLSFFCSSNPSLVTLTESLACSSHLAKKVVRPAEIVACLVNMHMAKTHNENANYNNFD